MSGPKPSQDDDVVLGHLRQEAARNGGTLTVRAARKSLGHPIAATRLTELVAQVRAEFSMSRTDENGQMVSPAAEAAIRSVFRTLAEPIEQRLVEGQAALDAEHEAAATALEAERKLLTCQLENERRRRQAAEAEILVLRDEIDCAREDIQDLSVQNRGMKAGITSLRQQLKALKRSRPGAEMQRVANLLSQLLLRLDELSDTAAPGE